MKQKIVLIQGNFELLHSGHVRSFHRAKGYGDYLIVALNTPKLVKNYKNRTALLSYKDKKLIIESIKFVDKVVPAPDFSPLKLLKKYDVDIYMIASEWLNTKTEEIAYMKAKGGKIKMCHDYKNTIHSSDIRKMLLEQARAG